MCTFARTVEFRKKIRRRRDARGNICMLMRNTYFVRAIVSNIVDNTVPK